jgi:hypothetical protein
VAVSTIGPDSERPSRCTSSASASEQVRNSSTQSAAISGTMLHGWPAALAASKWWTAAS